MSSVLAEEEEKAKNLGKVKNKQEMMMVDLEGKGAKWNTECTNNSPVELLEFISDQKMFYFCYTIVSSSSFLI